MGCKRRKQAISLAVALLVSMLLVVLPASARVQLLTTPTQKVTFTEASSTPYANAPQALGKEFTIRTVVTVSGTEIYAGGDTVWLAGMGTTAGAAPSSLAIAWTPKPSWLGFTWTLQLSSAEGLIPAELLSSAATQEVVTVDLVRAEPINGHEYESLLSYDAATGSFSVRITDLTDDRVLYQGSFVTKRVSTPFYALSGGTHSSNTGGLSTDLKLIEVHPSYLPVGLSWVAGQQSSEADFLPMLRFERNDDINVQVKALGDNLPGSLVLRSVTESGTYELARTEKLEAAVLPTISAAKLPVGRSLLRLEYVENGVVLLSDTQEFTVGTANLTFSNVQIDKAARLIKGSVQVSSRGELPDIDLSVQAVLKQLVWNTERRAYEAKTYTTLTLFDKKMDIPDQAPAEIPLSIPLPDQPGYWQVSFEPSVTQSIGALTANALQRFSTYTPAVLAPGESFTIAILPDTQYYAQTYPETFVRQLQWIAEQADDRNIVLTLHLGDITDDNIPGQWLNAVQSMKLLDGVMPYVLTQGNHDIKGTDGIARNRADSMINAYFPLSDQPWITGTFEKGRIENSYSLFTFQDAKYLVLSLEFGPRDAVLAWANQIVAEHPDHKVIMITHNYTGRSGARSNSANGYDLPETNAGPDMWYGLVQKHANFQLVLSGHIHSDAIPINVALGQNRNWVYEMLMDYQSDPHGGNGYLGLMTFHPDGRIEMRSYSPYLGQDRTMRDQYGFSNHFIIETAKGRYVKQ